MFELSNKTDKIKLYFFEVITNYKMHIKEISLHIVQLRNDVCIIEFSTERYYCDFTITFINPKNNERFGLAKILDKIGLPIGSTLLNENEIVMASQISDELEYNFFVFDLIIKKYLAKVLNGDFSVIND